MPRLLIVLLVLVPAIARADEWFFGAQGAGTLPVGNWKDFVAAGRGGYAVETPQFGAGGHLALTAGFSRSRHLAAIVEVSHTRLGTGGWEAASARAGRTVDAQAALTTAALGGLLWMPGRDRPLTLELTGRVGLLVPSGSERAGAATVDYSFLRTTLFGAAGVRLASKLGDRVQVFAGVDFRVAPGGVRYTELPPGVTPDQVSTFNARTIAAVEPGAGVRLWLPGW